MTAGIGRNSTAFSIGLYQEDILVFQHTLAEGMVGEDIEWVDAYLITTKNPPVVKKLKYEEVKSYYKQIKGRRSRVEFWGLMHMMSPEGIEESAERSYQQAIGYVR